MTRAAVAIAFTALATAAVFREAPRAIVWRSPAATLGDPFTSIHSVRELADGRVFLNLDSKRTIGFGPRSIYVSVRDDDGFHQLRRHPWP